MFIMRLIRRWRRFRRYLPGYKRTLLPFSPLQTEVIRRLFESGDKLAAQRLILSILEDWDADHG